MKKVLLPIVLIAVLGAGVYLARAFGFGQVANILDAQAASYMAQYHAVKAEQAADDAVKAVEEASATTAQ